MHSRCRYMRSCGFSVLQYGIAAAHAALKLFLVPVMCRRQQEETLELALLVAVRVESCMFDGHILPSPCNQAIRTVEIVRVAMQVKM